MNEVQEEQKAEAKTAEDAEAMVPLKKHRKERKRLKAEQLKYNKFQPPPPAQQALYNTQTGNYVGNAHPQTFPMQDLQSEHGGEYGSMPRRPNNLANHTQHSQTYYVQPQGLRGGGGDDTEIIHSSIIAQNQVIESDVREIKRILRTYIQRLNEKDAQARIAKEWRIVAKVIDRIFFFGFLATIFVSLATVFPKGD